MWREEEQRKERKKTTIFWYKKGSDIFPSITQEIPNLVPSLAMYNVCDLIESLFSNAQWMTLPQIQTSLPVEQGLNLRGAEELTLCSLLLGSSWTPNAFYFLRKILKNWLGSYSLKPATCQEDVSVRHCTFSSSIHWAVDYFLKCSLPIFTLAENLKNRNSKSIGTSLVSISQWKKYDIMSTPSPPNLILLFAKLKQKPD